MNIEIKHRPESSIQASNLWTKAPFGACEMEFVSAQGTEGWGHSTTSLQQSQGLGAGQNINHQTILWFHHCWPKNWKLKATKWDKSKEKSSPKMLHYDHISNQEPVFGDGFFHWDWAAGHKSPQSTKSGHWSCNKASQAGKRFAIWIQVTGVFHGFCYGPCPHQNPWGSASSCNNSNSSIMYICQLEQGKQKKIKNNIFRCAESSWYTSQTWDF